MKGRRAAASCFRGPSASALSCLAVCLLALAVTAARAQKPEARSGGVARSGMEHGQAKISVRSDVRLAIRGIKGTPSRSVDALAEAVRGRMPPLQACYGRLVAKRPTIAGKLRVLVDFAAKRSKPSLALPEDADSELNKCVRGVLGKMTLPAGHRPAAAIVHLDFSNTRARGQEKLDTRKTDLDGIEVTAAQDGTWETSWKSDGGEVTFVVTAESSMPRDAVAGVQRALKNGIGAFLDCRRMAGKRGMPKTGPTVAQLRLRRHGDPVVKIRSSKLKNERAVRCIERALRRQQFDATPRPSQTTVEIRFGE